MRQPDPEFLEPQPALHSRKAVFLDLNGTLVLPITPEHPRGYDAIADAADAVAVLCRAGFVCPVVTVQSCVEKGLYTQDQFREWLWLSGCDARWITALPNNQV
jgi:histidinol phosphatase-like enzyme